MHGLLGLRAEFETIANMNPGPKQRGRLSRTPESQNHVSLESEIRNSPGPPPSRVERTRGRTVIQLEGREFPTPVTFGEDGEQNLLAPWPWRTPCWRRTRTRGS